MRQREQAMLLLKKAHHDQALVEKVLGAEDIADDIIGFHCQQAVEKLLKALLSMLGVRFRKTHDLREIMDLLADSGHPVPDDLQESDALTPYAVLLRYDAHVPDLSLDRQQALDVVSRVRAWVEPQIPADSEE